MSQPSKISTELHTKTTSDIVLTGIVLAITAQGAVCTTPVMTAVFIFIHTSI